jgi:hypothetical protein
LSYRMQPDVRGKLDDNIIFLCKGWYGEHWKFWHAPQPRIIDPHVQERVIPDRTSREHRSNASRRRITYAVTETSGLSYREIRIKILG